MQKIPIHLARADMLLAKPVTRPNGMVLVPAGTVLTEALLSKLESMDVEEIVVEGEPMNAEGGAEALAQKMEHLEHLFRHFKNDKYMQRMKTMVGEYYAQKFAFAAPVQSKQEE